MSVSIETSGDFFDLDSLDAGWECDAAGRKVDLQEFTEAGRP
jgi:hypothetical protein